MKNDIPNPPSELFVRAFCHSGSPMQQCDFCGRLNYNVEGEFMEEGELERIEANAKKNPEKYNPQHGSISWGEIGGKTFVEDCPCNQLRKYEDFIWHHRYQIARYLKKETERNLKDAQRDSDSAASIPKDMK